MTPTTQLFGGALFSAGLTYDEASESAHRGSTTKRGCRGIAAALVATSSLIFVTPAFADIIHVPRDFPTIQGAIDASVDSDEIIVAPGEYVESIDLLHKAITLRSSDGRDVTVIDGNQGGTVVEGAGSGATLSGFTVTGGGIGMLNGNPATTVINCTFVGHSIGMWNTYSSATIIDCTFVANSSVGMWNLGYSPSPTIIGCTFTAHNGPAMDNQYSAPVIIGCTFTDNDIGIDAYFGSDTAWIANCVFSGSGVELDYSDALVVNCSMTGAGMGAYHGSLTAINCTVTDGSVWLAYSDAQLTNCIIWGNADNPIDLDEDSSVEVTYSDIEGGYPGEGNIDADPLFVDPVSGNYRLMSGSPCIDAGDNDALPLDEYDLDEDGDTMEPLPFDLGGNTRFVDDPNTKDTGVGRPPIVDMGAYEFQGARCTWDLNDDGVVGTGDLILLLGSWGDPYGTQDLIELLGNWGSCP